MGQGVEEEIILSKILPLVDYTEIPTYKTFLINLNAYPFIPLNFVTLSQKCSL